MSQRNLEQRASNDKNGQFAVSCILGRSSGKQVPKLPARRCNGRSASQRNREFCDILLTLETVHLRILLRVASHEKVAVLESKVLYLSWIQTQP
jgi:hypothetical protein